MRVIGIGNPLQGDDGLGPEVVRRLLQRELPAHVEVIDGGLGGIGLIELFADVARVMLVDAVDSGQPPGRFSHYDLSEIDLAGATVDQLHGGLPGLLALVRELQLCPRVELLAVQPADLGLGPSLSLPVAHVLDEVVDTLVRLLD